jgi:hypothetical protein
MHKELRTVEIVEDKSGIVYSRWTADNFRRAEKIAAGAAVNLDHDKFSVNITKGGA